MGSELFSPTGRLVMLRRIAQARRLSLRVDPVRHRAVLVTPTWVKLAEAQRFLDMHAAWLEDRFADMQPPIVLDVGTYVPVRGSKHLIMHYPRTSRRVFLDGDTLLVGGPDRDGVPGRVMRWLKTEARTDLQTLLLPMAETLNVRIAGITIKDTRRQWGSASATGRLNFSWRLILAPSFVLRYVAAHEVSHLRHMDHSSRFWATVDMLVDDRAQAKAWLKRFGTDLHRYSSA